MSIKNILYIVVCFRISIVLGHRPKKAPNPGLISNTGREHQKGGSSSLPAASPRPSGAAGR